MTNISKETLHKIKEKSIRPLPKWHFAAKRSVTWILFGLSIVFGSVASGIALFQAHYADWDLYTHLDHSLIEFILLILPYLWLMILAVFTVTACYFYRHTSQGYRYRTMWVVVLSFSFSILGGFFLHASGLSERLETIFQENIPFYRKLDEHKQQRWLAPAQGFLAGTITKVLSPNRIEIADLRGNPWEIDVENVQWRGRLKPEENLRIKIVGRMTGTNSFIAEEIRPWEGQRRLNQGHGSRRDHEKGRKSPH